MIKEILEGGKLSEKKVKTIQQLRSEWFPLARALEPNALADWTEGFDKKELKKLEKGIDLVSSFFYDNEQTK